MYTTLDNKEEFCLAVSNVMRCKLEDCMRIKLTKKDMSILFSEANSVSFPENFPPVTSTKNVIDDVLWTCQDVVSWFSSDILEHNCYNNDYELLQAKEDESPLETVFRSMSAAVVEDISSALQKEIEAKTGRNPLKDPWVLK